MMLLPAESLERIRRGEPTSEHVSEATIVAVQDVDVERPGLDQGVEQVAERIE